MKFSSQALTMLAVIALHVGLAASSTESDVFLAQHPDIQVGRDALVKAEAAAGPDSFSIVNKPADGVVLYQHFDPDTHERVSAVALVDDKEAETYYKTYNKDGDAKGAVMKRFDAAVGKCSRSEQVPRGLFPRASRCGQFCSRGHSCTVDRRCPACRNKKKYKGIRPPRLKHSPSRLHLTPTPTKSSRFCVMPENTAPYQTRGLPPMPAVSRQTLPMGGLLVDVYGLDELPAGDRSALPTTCLWLLHPRTRARGHMADIASRVLAAWHAAAAPQTPSRNLVALAFDMPNHGSRLVSAAANEAWDGGNATHAVDMLGMVKGAVADMAGLMDLVEAYLGLRAADAAHVCLGWSLGGHSAWQAWIGEDRIDAAVVVVGCPDFTNLMSTRAAAGNLVVPAGSSFLGSSHFPPSLARVCAAHDPKALLFGADDNHRRRPVPDVPLGEDDRERVRSVLDRHRVAGKRLLLCSGGRDTLVPAAVGQPVVDVLTEASAGWYPAMSVESRVYEDVGHAFSKDMVTDAVAFLVDAVARGPRERESKAKI
ncbi:hypothetical protein CCM_09602 [Cordyceps militaris CM01]|uniref:AB hydrolase-1 domain-containing protein n=1 Tax=Cordyceps militaris (strain CM01) TaxID=983644 RepID=G3JUW1_CORMM|nr:uncharacterized protein CCM_09602 [Cordyceps militaris CM01]EGX87641.1 hypothetical protein CCM_09602 [Cordyceps militaris CM01]